MTEAFDSIAYKQKILIATITIAIGIIAVFKLAIYPVFEKNTTLTRQIDNQVQLSAYLRDSQDVLVQHKIFPSLNPKQAQNSINAIFKNVTSNTAIDGNNITLLATAQNFSKILNNIQRLKLSHGIVVLQANITKVKEGLVDVRLEFGYPL